MKNKIVFVICFFIITSCGNSSLPIYGERQVIVKIIDGKQVADTIYQTVPNFSLTNQDGKLITENLIKNKIYIADFFFVTCPTICPRMKKNLLKVYETYKDNQEVLILSHTIDPEHDTVEVLKNYADRLGADSKQWHFLTGKREKIYELAEHGYYSIAVSDTSEPGGYVHSGGLILVDKKRRVRGIYDGTNESATAKLILDISTLMHEKE